MAHSHHGRLAFAAAAMVIATSAAMPAQQESNTVQVAARVATFLQPALSGQVVAAIIYQPGDPESENEARLIERAIGSGLVVGGLRLKCRRVAVGATRDLAGIKVAFVTGGVNYGEVGALAAARSILTFGSDPGCTKQGHCIVAITATPKVQITVSKAALKAANLRFSSGFLMLIKEI